MKENDRFLAETSLGVYGKAALAATRWIAKKSELAPVLTVWSGTKGEVRIGISPSDKSLYGAGLLKQLYASRDAETLKTWFGNECLAQCSDDMPSFNCGHQEEPARYECAFIAAACLGERLDGSVRKDLEFATDKAVAASYVTPADPLEVECLEKITEDFKAGRRRLMEESEARRKRYVKRREVASSRYERIVRALDDRERNDNDKACADFVKSLKDTLLQLEPEGGSCTDAVKLMLENSMLLKYFDAA